MKIKIRYRKNLIDTKGRQLNGFTYRGGKSVLITSGLTKGELFETLVHELTHVALVLSKIKVSDRRHERVAYQVGKAASKSIKGIL